MVFKTLYLVRHGEAYHNVTEDYSLLDPELTPLGRSQSTTLSLSSSLYVDAELLVTSPLKRPIQTLLLAFPDLISKLGGKNQIVLLPSLQEAESKPCDTGIPSQELEKIQEFDGIDFSTLPKDWEKKVGINEAERAGERAGEVRRWLWERKEDKIVVVAHGDILRLIADGEQTYRIWNNAEVQVYTFSSREDEGTSLIRVLK